MTLAEASTLVRGNGMPKSDFVEEGVPAIHYGEIYTHYGMHAKETKSFVSEETAKRLAQVHPGDIVITNTSENLEDVGKAVLWLGTQTAVTGGHATVLATSENSKYLMHYLKTRSFQDEKRKRAVGTKVIDVSAKGFAAILVPFPAPEIQSAIAEQLDKFDALVNDISIGLPAEIAARRKQYEFYRNQLLSFEEIPA